MSPFLGEIPKNECLDGRRGHLISLQKSRPRFSVFIVTPCGAHQEPWIPAPFRIRLISSLSLLIVIPEGLLLLQSLSHCPRMSSIGPCGSSSPCHLGGASLLLWDTGSRSYFTGYYPGLKKKKITALLVPGDLLSPKQLLLEVRGRVHKPSGLSCFMPTFVWKHGVSRFCAVWIASPSDWITAEDALCWPVWNDSPEDQTRQMCTCTKSDTNLGILLLFINGTPG